MVVETCRACSSGEGPSEMTQAAKVPEITKTAAAAAAAKRTIRRRPPPSWPGLSRPSTSSFVAAKVDARVTCAKTRFALLPGHDEEFLLPDALISPHGPRPSRCW